MDEGSRTRVRISNGCAVVGVLLLMLTAVLPARWLPAIPLFLGLALIVVAHVLTPCQDQMTEWWKRRISKSPRDRFGNQSPPSDCAVHGTRATTARGGRGERSGAP
jgi:hypothetical protein